MKFVTTEKLNRNMKTKVLKYKFDGDTIVAPYMELETVGKCIPSRWQEKTNMENKSEAFSCNLQDR